MRRIRLRSFLRIRRCVSYHVVICVLVGCGGGDCRFHARLLSAVMGLCWKVGSSQCFRGDPNIRWALSHDLFVSSVRYCGSFSVVCGLGIWCGVGFVFCVKWLLSRRALMLFLMSEVLVS